MFPTTPVRILWNYTVALLPSYKCYPLKGDRLLVTTSAIVLLVKHLSVTQIINSIVDPLISYLVTFSVPLPRLAPCCHYGCKVYLWGYLPPRLSVAD